MQDLSGTRNSSARRLAEAAGHCAPPEAADWLLENAELLPARGRVLDLAAGAGRNALPLALAGFEVCALDADPERLGELTARAERLGVTIETRLADLEIEGRDLGSGEWDAIVVVHYLHRPLFPAIARALRPGGVLVYETFTRGQAARGRPRNPAFLLEDDELPALVRPLEVLRSRQGDFGGRLVAGVVARKATP